MKTKIYIMAMLLFCNGISLARNNNTVSLGMSFNKMSLGYRYDFEKMPFWAGAFLGLGNEDVNAGFNDFLFGIKIGQPILSFSKSGIYGALSSGIYVPNNKYYAAITPFFGVDLGYEFCFGENGNHILFSETGYRYGHRDYEQSFENEIISINSVDTFELMPFNIILGYGYRF